MQALPKSLARTFEVLERSMDALEQAVDEAKLSMNDSTQSEDAKVRAQRDATKALALAGLTVILSKVKGEESEDVEKQFDRCKQSCEKVRQGLSERQKANKSSSAQTSSTSSSTKTSSKPSTSSPAGGNRSNNNSKGSSSHKNKKQRH